jgi:tetratricopeptide (TPR) repeat protein
MGVADKMKRHPFCPSRIGGLESARSGDMLRIVKGVITLAALVVVYQVAAAANGTAVPSAPAPSGGTGPAPRTLTPEEMAVNSYNSGLDHRTKGAKAEDKAASAKKDSDKAKEEKKAREEYEKALKDFKKAAELNPSLPQAYNGMGFAYRKLGDYAKALENYDRALQLAPNFPDAIEYRGEAYLGLNRIDDAKQAYLALFAADRKHADLLMKAMTDWVAKKKVDPAGLDAAALTAFEAWIKERSGVAEQTRPMALNFPHTSWQ